MSIQRPSRRTTLTLVVVVLASLLMNLLFGAFRVVRTDENDGGRLRNVGSVSLPSPRPDGDRSVEEALASRRSRREYADRPLNRAELG